MANQDISPVRWRFPFGLVLMIIAISCGRYGGTADSVNVSVLNDGDRISFFMIPEEDWDRNGGRRMLDHATVRDRYEMGRTPQRNLVKRSGVYVLAWRCGGSWETDRITASRGVTNEVSIGCGGAP